MAKAIKWALGGIAVAILAAAGAIAVAIVMIDPNDYKPRIQGFAQDRGIELEIPGDLSWQLFPRFAVQVGEMRAADRAGRLPVAAVRSASLQLSLLALLRGQLAIRAIAIDGLDLNFDNLTQAAAAGVGALTEPPAQAGKPPAQTGRPQKSAGAENNELGLAVDTFSLSNSRVTLPGKGAPRVLSNLALTGRDLNVLAKPFPFSIAFDYSDPALPSGLGENLGVEINTRASADRANQALRLTETQIALSPKGKPPLHGSFDLNLNQRSGEVFLDKLSLAHGGAALSGQLTLRELFSAPQLRGNFSVAPFDLRKALAGWGVELTGQTDATALTRVGLSTNIVADTQQLKLDALDMVLDDSRLRGALALEFGMPRTLSLALTGDTIQVDRYAAPEDPGKGAATAVFAPLAGAIAWLGGGAGTLETTWGTLASGKLRLNDFHLGVATAGTRVEIKDLSAKVFDGSIKTTARIELAGSPTLDFKGRLDDISLTAARVVASDIPFEGLVDLSISGTTRGETSAELHRNFNANGTLSVAKPVLTSMNVERSYCELAAMVDNTETPSQWPPGAQLKDIDSGFHVAGDNLVLDNYTTGIGNLGVNGRGVIDTAKKTFDILAIARLSGDKTSDGGCIVKSKRIRDRDIPLRCKDSFANAGANSCRPDGDTLNALLQDKVLERIKEKTGVEGESGKALESLLKGVLGRKATE